MIEEVWSTAVFNSTDKVITFNLKGITFSINGDILSSCLHFSANTHAKPPSKTEIRLGAIPNINYCQ